MAYFTAVAAVGIKTSDIAAKHKWHCNDIGYTAFWTET